MVGLVGGLFTHQSFFVGMYSWLFNKGWNYPLYSSGFMSFGLFLVSICFIIRNLLLYKDPNKQLCFLSLFQNCVTSIFFSGHIVFMSLALFQKDMLASRFLMIAQAADLLWIMIFSPLILGRTITLKHLLALVLSLIAYLIWDMLLYEGFSLENFKMSPSSKNWRGPLFCVISRMLCILSGVISKRFLLSKGYMDRLKERNFRQETTSITNNDLDERGNLKQRYVKKSSVIYKRAQFYKALNDKIISESSKNEEFENTTTNSKSRRSSEETNPDKKRALENLKRLQRSSIDRLLKSKFAFLQKRFTVVSNSGGQQSDHSGGKNGRDMGAGNSSTVQEENPAAKFENDFFENLELEAMIDDYEYVQFHMHLFTGFNDIFLSKLDSIFDMCIYDDLMVGFDEYSTYEINSVGGALGAFPITLICSFFSGEMPHAYNDLLHGQIIGPMGENYAPLAAVSVFSLLFALRPYFLHKLVFNTSPFHYFLENLLCYFIVLIISIIFIEISGNLSSTKSIALLISAFSYFLFYNATVSLIRTQEIESSIELLKSTLNLGTNISELN